MAEDNKKLINEEDEMLKKMMSSALSVTYVRKINLAKEMETDPAINVGGLYLICNSDFDYDKDDVDANTILSIDTRSKIDMIKILYSLFNPFVGGGLMPNSVRDDIMHTIIRWDCSLFTLKDIEDLTIEIMKKFDNNIPFMSMAFSSKNPEVGSDAIMSTINHYRKKCINLLSNIWFIKPTAVEAFLVKSKDELDELQNAGSESNN